MSLLNLSTEDAEEYSQSLGQIAEGWWRQVAWAFRQGIPDALGMSQEEWKHKYFGHIRVSRAELPEAAVELTDQGFTQRETADVLGVGLGSINRALNPGAEDDVPNGTREENAIEKEEVEASDSQSVVPDGTEELWADPELGEDDPESDPDPQSDLGEIEESELDHPVESVEEQVPDPEPAPLEPAAPGWHQLGNHWLYCGDSTDEEFINACKGVFAFADPPYNAGKATWDEGFEWQHDFLAEVADIVAVTPGIAALKGFHTVTEMPYQWSMAAEITNGMTRGALGFGNWIYVALFSNGSLYRNAKDYLRVPAHTGDDKGGNHAARKPLRLLTELIGLFTSKGDTVIDPFLGSGTTLIAAERTERRCIGAELDPMHCAEIIDRYKTAVG